MREEDARHDRDSSLGQASAPLPVVGVWATFVAIALKEILQLARNLTIIRALLILEAMDFAAVAFIDTTVHNMPMVLVDQDHTAESRELVDRIGATGTFAIRFSTTSTEQARAHIRAGRAHVALVIPPDYGRRKAGEEDTEILALVDGSNSVVSSQATASLEGLATHLNATAIEGRGKIEARSVLLFNPEGSIPFFMLPGLLALLLGQSFGDKPMSLATEREEGNLERLLMTPMSATGLMLGKLVPHFLLAMMNAIIYLLLMRWGFGVPIRGSMLLMFAGVSLFILTFLSLALFIAAGAKSEMDASMTLLIVTFPAFMLSGYLFPLTSLPKPLLPVAYLMPETHCIEILRGVCLRGAGLADLAPHFIVLGIAPIALLYGAARRFEASILD